MQITLLHGYPDYVGKRFILCGYGNGPTSYAGTSGDVVSFPRFGNYIDIVFGGVFSVSKNYYYEAQPSGIGPRQSWSLRYFYGAGQGVDSISIATAGSGQTNGTYTVNGSGGGGTGATVQITIAGGAVTNAVVSNPGSGYTSVPTFTVAEGGTPGTLTATIGDLGGTEVATGVNLSAEQFQVGAFGGQY